MKALRAVVLAGLWLAAGQGAGASESALLTVDVYRGLESSLPPIAPPAPERVEVVVDLSRSMERPAPGGRSHADLARSRAAALLRSLDAGAESAVTVFGHAAGAGCTEAERLAAPVRGDRAASAARLRELTPRSEASLARALDSVRRHVESGRRTRVVVLTDLGDVPDAAPGPPGRHACGGDLCAAARRLVASGAWLEIAPTGEADPPACLAELLPSPARPSGASGGEPPTFSVATGADRVVAEGRAGAGAVEVPPGLVTLRVDLDPPEQIGPFRLGPGESARVSVLETLEGGAPSRIWRIERGDEAVGRAFPPPDELPRRR
jgi:hypothetical protein